MVLVFIVLLVLLQHSPKGSPAKSLGLDLVDQLPKPFAKLLGSGFVSTVLQEASDKADKRELGEALTNALNNTQGQVKCWMSAPRNSDER